MAITPGFLTSYTCGHVLKTLRDFTWSRCQWESMREGEASPEDSARMSPAKAKEEAAGRNACTLNKVLPSRRSSRTMWARRLFSTLYTPVRSPMPVT